MNAPHAAIRVPRGGMVCRVRDLPSLRVGADTFGSAPPIAATENSDESARLELRALILAAMRARRAVLIDRAKEAKRNRQRKALSICEAEIVALTNGLLFMEAAND